MISSYQKLNEWRWPKESWMKPSQHVKDPIEHQPNVMSSCLKHHLTSRKSLSRALEEAYELASQEGYVKVVHIRSVSSFSEDELWSQDLKFSIQNGEIVIISLSKDAP